MMKDADGTATIQTCKGALDDLEVDCVTLKGNMTEGCPQEVELVVFNKGHDFRENLKLRSDAYVMEDSDSKYVYNHFPIKSGMRDTLHLVYYLPAGNHF